MGKGQLLDIGGTSIEVSNLDKIFYPKTGFTKGGVIDYYIKVSPALLPHLQDRPLSLKRYPNGVEGLFFYEKQCPAHRPQWIKTATVPRTEGGQIHYCMVNDLRALVWAANLADLELHTFLHRAPRVEMPTALAFDLDPGAPADVIACCDVALVIKGIFDALKLRSFAKTSGSKGMQVYVPLNVPVDYGKTKAFAQVMAEKLQGALPQKVVAKMSKALRAGKVFVDWSQNDTHKTTICVYSLRAGASPFVSTPLTWDEVASAARKKNPEQLMFETAAVLKRVAKYGDLFEPVLSLKQKLPPVDMLDF